MDPNAALAAIRSLIGDVETGEIPEGMERDHLDALAETIRALDDWITRGGFLPDAWARV